MKPKKKTSKLQRPRNPLVRLRAKTLPDGKKKFSVEICRKPVDKDGD